MNHLPQSVSVQTLLLGVVIGAAVGFCFIRKNDKKVPPLRTTTQKISVMPKVELHVHLDGSFDEIAMFAEAKAQLANGEGSHLPDQVTLFGETLSVRHAIQSCRLGDEFKKLVSCKGKRNLHAMFKCFEIFLPIVRGRLELLEELAFRFVQRQSAQSVVYTEVRYSPHLLSEGGLLVGDADGSKDIPKEEKESADAIVAAITKGLRRGEEQFGVTVNQIMCCLAFRPDWAEDVVRIANERRSDFPCAVVGIDVAGGEEWFPKPQAPMETPPSESASAQQEGEVSPTGPDLHTAHVNALKKAQDLKLNITLHAGEDTNCSNIGEAVFSHGAQRIGHGYHLTEDKTLMAKLIEMGIHFECCPTSSYETGGWVGSAAVEMNWKKHPLKVLMTAGASVGLNSDDPSVFDTSLTDEMRLMNEEGDLDFADLIACTLNAADAAFLTPAKKEALRQEIMAHFDAIH